MKGKLESTCNDQKSIQTMATASASTVPKHGPIDVGIDGSLAGAVGVVTA
jgi:hypothetical protein